MKEFSFRKLNFVPLPYGIPNNCTERPKPCVFSGVFVRGRGGGGHAPCTLKKGPLYQHVLLYTQEYNTEVVMQVPQSRDRCILF